MSFGGLMAGTQTYLVGIEEQDDGGLRLYLGHRADGLYAVIYDEDVKANVRAAWAGKHAIVTVPTPPSECIYQEAPDAK